MKIIVKRIFLGLFFIFFFLFYGSIIFPLFTLFIDNTTVFKIFLNKSIFYNPIFLYGVGFFLSIILTNLINDLLKHKRILSSVNWRKLFTIIFCMILFFSLTNDVERIVPEYMNHDWEGGFPFVLQILAFVFAIAYLMYPKKFEDFNKCKGLIKESLEKIDYLNSEINNYFYELKNIKNEEFIEFINDDYERFERIVDSIKISIEELDNHFEYLKYDINKL